MKNVNGIVIINNLIWNLPHPPTWPSISSKSIFSFVDWSLNENEKKNKLVFFNMVKIIVWLTPLWCWLFTNYVRRPRSSFSTASSSNYFMRKSPPCLVIYFIRIYLLEKISDQVKKSTGWPKSKFEIFFGYNSETMHF